MIIKKKIILIAILFFIFGVVVGVTINKISDTISSRTPKTAQLSDNVPQKSSQENAKFRIDTIQENTKEHKIDIEYPQLVIEQNDATAASSINSDIKKFVDDNLSTFKLGWRECNSSGKCIYPSPYVPTGEPIQNTFSLSYKIANLTDNVYSLEIHTSKWYREGNSPDNAIITYNYDLKRNKVINFTDLFIKPKDIVNLSSIILIKLQDKYKGNEDNFDGKLKDFQLRVSADFLLYKDGLEILFGYYELGDRTIGEPRVFIPYSEIKNIISPDYVFLTK